jgi:signal transduction histidine kinase
MKRATNLADLYRFAPDKWTALAGRGVFQEIVDNARVVLNTPYACMYCFDHTQDTIQIVSVSAPLRGLVRHGHLLAQRTIENYGDHQAKPINHASADLLKTLEGQTYQKSVLKADLGYVGYWDNILGWMLGFRHYMNFPIKIRTPEGEVVIGFLSFVQSRPFFGTQKIRAGEAFARQAGMTLENALLSLTLGRKVQELQQTQSQLLRSEEHIKQEIAEMLHSRVQMRLLVAWHKLGDLEEQLGSDHHRQLLADLRSELDHIREHDVRAASHALHPSVINLGLSNAVFSLADELASELDVRLEVAPELEVYERETGLEPELRLAAYRVIEEAISNSLKHGQARKVIVRLELANLEQMNPDLRLSIHDDGNGFKVGAIKPGLGFATIEARVSVMNGHWTLESDAQGTRLMASLPTVARRA